MMNSAQIDWQAYWKALEERARGVTYSVSPDRYRVTGRLDISGKILLLAKDHAEPARALPKL